jgi:glycosyl-4,4'-diaponeurosporenoate acyltransferase
MIVPLSESTAVAVSVVAWVAASLVIGRWAVSWPDHRLEATGPFTRLRGWERHGGWWIRHLRVLRWKDQLPEAGEFFAGGRSKRHVGSPRREALSAFRRETIRAERVHWLVMATGPVHLIWCPPVVGAGMVAFGVVFDAPFIIVQRVNRGRIDRVLKRRSRPR